MSTPAVDQQIATALLHFKDVGAVKQTNRK